MMLYLGIDQHARQITISLRDDQGDVLLTRQVSTRPEKIQAFFQKLILDMSQNRHIIHRKERNPPLDSARLFDPSCWATRDPSRLVQLA